jgi:hypothetical protein
LESSVLFDLDLSQPAEKVKGRVCVDYLKWSEEQLDMIRQPNVTWGMYWNDDDDSDDDDDGDDDDNDDDS